MDTIKQIIDKFNLISKKSLGQNYILDENITNKIVKFVDIKNQIILEIGPGPGCLTRSLINAGAKKIIAVEKDSNCIQALNYQKKNFNKKLFIIKGDVLKKDIFKKIQREILNHKEKVFVVSNLPYNIAIIILSKLLANRKLIKEMILMFQEEQANRIVAKKKTKDYGRISIIAQWLCYIEKKIKLSPNYFFPKPKINSSILLFKFKRKIKKVYNEELLLEIIKKSFNQRRKTIKNSLKSYGAILEEALNQSKIKENSRPEELDPDNFINLSNSLNNLKK